MWAFIRRKHCLRLQRWQGPPNLNKIVCLFSLSVKIIQRRCSSPYSISSQKQHNALLIFTDDLSKVLHKREQSNTILFLFHLDKWHNSTCSPQPMIHTLFTQTRWLTVSTLQAALQLLFFPYWGEKKCATAHSMKWDLWMCEYMPHIRNSCCCQAALII